MDTLTTLKRKEEKKGNLIIKTWARCKSIGRSRKQESVPAALKRTVAPEGCFSVYVGPQKQRFVIKTEYVNHSLFKMLLEEAESEYGFHSDGPLVLPCKVDVFYRVLLALMDDHKDDNTVRQGCGFAQGYASYRLLSPSPMIAINQF